MPHTEKLIVAIASEALNLDLTPGTNIRLVRVENVADAEPWMSCPSLAAWIIGGGHDSDALAAFAERANRAQPNVPIVLMTGNPRELRPLGGISPDLVLVSGTSASEFSSKLDALACASTYRPEFISMVRDATETAFQSGFSDQFSAGDTCIRTSRLPGHEFNAVLPMCGPETSGRMSVSASRSTLHKVHRHILPSEPEPTDHNLEDVIAEMTNQAVGMLKRECEDRGVRFDLGVPWTYRGVVCPVQYRTRTASLLMEIGSAQFGEALLVDLVLDVFQGKLTAPVRGDEVEFGEVSYL